MYFDLVLKYFCFDSSHPICILSREKEKWEASTPHFFKDTTQSSKSTQSCKSCWIFYICSCNIHSPPFSTPFCALAGGLSGWMTSMGSLVLWLLLSVTSRIYSHEMRRWWRMRLGYLFPQLVPCQVARGLALSLFVVHKWEWSTSACK